MRINKSLRPRVLAAAIVMLAAHSAVAQTSGGSTYSIFNLGDLRGTSTAAAAGRGGVEAAVPSPWIINSVNPAMWADLEFVTLQAALNFEQYEVSDANTTIRQNHSKLQDFAAAFPYSDRFGGTLAFGVRPYSTVNYRTQVARDVPTADSSARASITYGGRGGLSEALLGSSFSPVEWLSLGVSGSLYFGSITSESAIEFPANNNLNPALYRTSDLYFGSGIRAGLSAKPVEDLILAGVFESGSTLTRERYESSRFIDNNREIIDTTSIIKDELKIPSKFTAGASYLLGRFLISTDAAFQSWSTEHFSTARASGRYAIGVDRMPSTSMNASGFERWSFRFGGYYDQTYYQLTNGQGIDQMGVTLGARYPISNSGHLTAGTALDVAIELGRRGSIDNGLTQELYGKLWIELAVSELWFVRRR